MDTPPQPSLKRLLFLKWAVCAGALSGMGVAPKLWLTDRGFPTLPAYPWIPDLPNWACIFVSAALALSLIGVAFAPRPGWWALAPVAIGGFLAVFDMSRLQPWIYEYGLMLVGLSLIDWNDSASLRRSWAVCSCVAIGVYFWSGLHKINPIFATQVFPFLVAPLGPKAAGVLAPFWPIAPVVEAGTAVLLFFSRTRNWGVGLGIAMHLVILTALGPFGENYDQIVWPWNFWIAVIVAILFFNFEESIFPSTWLSVQGKLVVSLALLLPALNLVNFWDGFLSWSYYSGKLRDGWIYLTAEGERALPKEVREGNKGLVQESPNRYRLDILVWSMSKLNAPLYGEPRFYPEILRRLESQGVPRPQMLLVIQDPVSYRSADRSFTQHSGD